MTFRESIRRRGRETVPFHEHDGSDISGEVVASTMKAEQFLGGTITGEEFIIAGGVLGILRSDNFVAGSAGWRALGDGTFEAQDGIFRGTLNADDMIAGILVAARIGVKTLTAEKLIIGSVDNLIQNPGLEDGVLSPHVVVASSTGSWALRTLPRSGAVALRYSFGAAMSVAARLALNGAIATREAHPDVAEGDEIYFTAWARSAAPLNGTTDVRISISFYDETGVLQGSSTFSSTIDPGNTWLQMEVSATAPAGSAYVVCEPIVLASSTSTTGEALFDDCYARRKVGTLIIEDQAVDIERMLNPVHQDGANAKVNNVTVNTTRSEMVSATITLPSFVGEVNALLVGTCQMTDSTERLIILGPEIGGTSGADSNQEISNAGISETVTFSVQQHRKITSPGSSVKFALQADLSVGSNTDNQFEFAAFLTGIR